MKEKKETHEDNTSITIAIIVAVLLIVGLIAYFVMNGNNDVKDAIDDTTDTIENATDNDQKTAADVAGSYQASINNDNGEDVAEDTESFIELVLNEDGTAKLYISDETDSTVTGTFTINNNNRLSLISDNSATDNNAATDNDTSDTDLATNNGNTTTNDNSDTNTNTTANDNGSANNVTYNFTINGDDTITYTSGNNNVTLAKVDNDSLRYIK